MLTYEETVSITKAEYIALQRTARKVEDVRLYEAMQRAQVMRSVKALLHERQHDLAELYLWLYQQYERGLLPTYLDATAYFGISARAYYVRVHHLVDMGLVHVHQNGRVTLTALEVA